MMTSAPGLPGLHPGGATNFPNTWMSQQIAANQPYETGLPATVQWNVAAQQVRFLTLAQNTTFAFPTNAIRGATYVLVLKQDSTGSRTGTFSNQASSLGTGTWKWPSGTAPTLTTTASKIDVLTFIFDGADMLGSSLLNF